MADAATYPLVFSFKDLVAGAGFFAGVIGKGRVLLTEEAEGYWLSGVTPGGIAAGGTTRDDAFRAFKEQYRSVILDIAHEAPNFDAFDRALRRFFGETNETSEAEWSEALAQVREGKLTADDLPRETNTSPVLQVTLLRTGSPDANDSSSFAEAA